MYQIKMIKNSTRNSYESVLEKCVFD